MEKIKNGNIDNEFFNKHFSDFHFYIVIWSRNCQKFSSHFTHSSAELFPLYVHCHTKYTICNVT